MTDRPTDLCSLPSYQSPRRSLFSVRKLALMGSVVAGLGIAAYGFGPSHDPANIFSSPAQAQVNTEVSKVAQPTGFAAGAAADAGPAAPSVASGTSATARPVVPMTAPRAARRRVGRDMEALLVRRRSRGPVLRTSRTFALPREAGVPLL